MSQIQFVVSSLWCFVGVFILELGEVVWLVCGGSSGDGKVVVVIFGSIALVGSSLMFASMMSLDSGSWCVVLGYVVACLVGFQVCVLVGMHWESVGSSALSSSASVARLVLLVARLRPLGVMLVQEWMLSLSALVLMHAGVAAIDGGSFSMVVVSIILAVLALFQRGRRDVGVASMSHALAKSAAISMHGGGMEKKLRVELLVGCG